MTSPVADASVYSNLSGLAALKRDARAQDPNAVREVARQFESIFAKMVLSSMRQATFGDSLLGSSQTEFYQGMFDDQLAMELARGRGLGLADLLVQQLTRAGLVPSAAADGTTTDAFQGSSSPSPARGQPAIDAAAARRAAPAPGANATSPEEFISELWPCAEQAGRELGVDPRHLIAQAALETGWGKSLPCHANGASSFNFFGIKASSGWQGHSVSVKTLEFEAGLPMPRQARFRAYGSAAESFRDYVELLRNNPRYAAALNTGSDAKAFATALQDGGYATDPAYARKILAIAQNLPVSPPALKSADAAPMPSTMSPI